MDVLAYSRAMASFCRQRARFEFETELFWIREATEWEKLSLEHDGATPAYPLPAAGVAASPQAHLGRPRADSASFYYRCPKSASQRDVCTGRCELLLEIA